MKRLSIIIVSYKSDSVLFNCLTSISMNNDLANDLEVIVIDNYSESKIKEKLETGFYSFEIKYHKSSKNVGFGAANNIGARLSASNILFFLNPDTLIEKPIFSKIVERITKNINTVYGFTLMDKNRMLTNSYSFFYDSFVKYHILSLYKCFYFYGVNKSQYANRCCWPWGAAFAVDKGVFMSAGMFDEKIFLCNEEPDLLKRIPDRIIYISDDVIIHFEGHGQEVSEFRYGEFFRSLNYYFDKYGLRKSIWRYYISVTALMRHFFNKDKNSENYFNAWIRSSKLK